MEDSYCSSIENKLENEERTSRYRDWFVVYHNNLFRRGTELCPGSKLVLPRKHILDIVNAEHEENGHFGARKCYNKLKRDFWFPKMERTIRKILGGCLICQKVTQYMVGPMGTVTVKQPNELVCTDLLGPLPASCGGVQFIIVFVDAFSKYVLCRALKRATSRAILKVLEVVYLNEVGKPWAILSDNGSQFASKLWLSRLEILDIKCSHTSLYYPKGNMTERVNREIVRLLRAYSSQHTKWSNYLHDIEKWINHAVHESTGYAPVELHYLKRDSSSFLDINYPETSVT